MTSNQIDPGRPLLRLMLCLIWRGAAITQAPLLCPLLLPVSVLFLSETASQIPEPSQLHFRAMAFFDSDIVQEEAKRLFGDYQQLMQLGSEYGKFDREGKKKFIETMEELMGRYRVFMKRFELSEDFQAKLTVEQLRTQLSQFGITPEQMFEQMNSTLERMKAQVELPPSD